MPDSDEQQVRLLNRSDVHAIERLLRTSEYTYQRFTLSELPLLLQHYPAVGIFHDTTMYGFLLSQNTHDATAWIGGFGVSWTESDNYISILTTLLEHLTFPLMIRGVHYLHYSGNDIENDWLQPILLNYGFLPHRRLYAYDKLDYSIPSLGNQQMTIRPVQITNQPDQASDIPALLAIEKVCFEDLWRYDTTTFNDIATTHPYFVVAELNGQVVGYQFNTVDEESGYLVRIAVHPSVNHQGIGTRLMAEAIRFFQEVQVTRIMLNTQEDNNHAHRLYEWFDFIRLEQMGFVLRKAL
ncbi:MAG TPA: GNAT family N-acetyltransferase [Ktedonobacteraceae bacterium]|jgi:ribosomal protein S18 acetylase RimI-like enzyme